MTVAPTLNGIATAADRVNHDILDSPPAGLEGPREGLLLSRSRRCIQRMPPHGSLRSFHRPSFHANLLISPSPLIHAVHGTPCYCLGAPVFAPAAHKRNGRAPNGQEAGCLTIHEAPRRFPVESKALNPHGPVRARRCCSPGIAEGAPLPNRARRGHLSRRGRPRRP